MRERIHPAVKRTLGLAAAVLMTACATGPAKDSVSSKEAPAAIGPYSQAIKSGGMLFLSGQIPIDPGTGQVDNTASIEEQTRLVMENLKAVLAAGGMTMDDVVSTTVYMQDLKDFGRMNAVYGRYFKDKPPARATVQVARLPRDASIEISAIAAK